MELRYSNAFILWDRAGAMWTELKSGFRDFDAQNVGPNQVVFHGDGRYSLNVSLDRAAITDHKPGSDVSRELNEVIFDIDFFTLQPVSAGAFSATPWLERWLRVLARDSEGLLNPSPDPGEHVSSGT